MSASVLPTPGRRRILTLEKRAGVSAGYALAVRAGAVAGALVLAGILIGLSGKNPLDVYRAMFVGAFGSKFGFSETLVRTVPLLLCGLGVALAFKMQLWNIGAEGQLTLGAIAASWAALAYPDLPRPLLLGLMAVAAVIAGGLWCLVPGLFRAYLGASEIITTLLLNYVALNLLQYLVYGPWKDPQGLNFPLSPMFSLNATIPVLWGRVHWGLPVALLLAGIMYLVIWRTRWGYEIRVVGENPTAARYAGIQIVRNLLLVMFVSGMLAGLAGMMEVSGLIGRLQKEISPGYGYTAIIVAYLARLHPVSLIAAAFLFGGLQAGGYSAQTMGVPAAAVQMLQGAVLFGVLASEMFTVYRIRWAQKGEG